MASNTWEADSCVSNDVAWSHALFQALLRIEREKVGQLEHELAHAIASAQLPEVGLRVP